MQFIIIWALSVVLFFHSHAFANPYWDPENVPKDTMDLNARAALLHSNNLKTVNNNSAVDVLRIQLDWQEAGVMEKVISQNIAVMQLPTPWSVWRNSPPVYGAYVGGYADSPSTKSHSHKPGLNCVMDNKKQFCDICTRAIQEVVQSGIG